MKKIIPSIISSVMRELRLGLPSPGRRLFFDSGMNTIEAEYSRRFAKPWHRSLSNIAPLTMIRAMVFISDTKRNERADRSITLFNMTFSSFSRHGNKIMAGNIGKSAYIRGGTVQGRKIPKINNKNEATAIKSLNTNITMRPSPPIITMALNDISNIYTRNAS